jgi:hypothetical protein
MAKKNRQAYKQAPWRRQIQSIGLSLLPVVSIAILISLYLIISAQAAAAGLEIMNLHFEEEDVLRDIANLRTELAWVTSYTKMHKRAEKLGFEPAEEAKVHFMTIPGYRGQNPALIAPPPGDDAKSIHFINEAYNQSLSTWVFQTFFMERGSSFGGSQ